MTVPGWLWAGTIVLFLILFTPLAATLLYSLASQWSATLLPAGFTLESAGNEGGGTELPPAALPPTPDPQLDLGLDAGERVVTSLERTGVKAGAAYTLEEEAQGK